MCCSGNQSRLDVVPRNVPHFMACVHTMTLLGAVSGVVSGVVTSMCTVACNGSDSLLVGVGLSDVVPAPFSVATSGFGVAAIALVGN